MLRAKAGVNPYHGTIRKEIEGWEGDVWKKDVEPTAEDYDRALEVIEELKKVAEEEPGAKKFLYKLGRFANKSRLAVDVLLLGLGGWLPPHSDHSAMGEKMDEFSSSKLFEDAAARLKKMQEEGDRWGKDEKNHKRYHPDDQKYKKAA